MNRTTRTTRTAGDRSAAPAGPSRRGTRRAARLVGLTLAATSLMGAVAGPALADTPPAPTPGPQIAAPPPPLVPNLGLQTDVGVNTGKVWGWKASTGDTWADVTFLSNKPTVIVQFSTSKHVWVDGKPTMGAVSPQYLTGTPVPGNPGDLATGTTYRFGFSRDGLSPATRYYVLATIPGKPGQPPTYNASFADTRRRHVKMTPIGIKVIDDADHGFRGKGEMRFGFRVAPDAGATVASTWGSWTVDEHKLSDGDWLPLEGSGHGHHVETTEDVAVVQIQGIENDVDPFEYCAIQGGPVAPRQHSNDCYDFAYAEGYAPLPTGRYQGTHSQLVKASVSRSPALRFEVTVRVDTWYE